MALVDFSGHDLIKNHTLALFFILLHNLSYSALACKILRTSVNFISQLIKNGYFITSNYFSESNVMNYSDEVIGTGNQRKRAPVCSS